MEWREDKAQASGRADGSCVHVKQGSAGHQMVSVSVLVRTCVGLENVQRIHAGIARRGAGGGWGRTPASAVRVKKVDGGSAHHMPLHAQRRTVGAAGMSLAVQY